MAARLTNLRLIKKIKNRESTGEEDGNTCAICFDIWSNSGEHRLSALKCGHLFGHSCLQQWLNNHTSCPMCQMSASKSDIRFIYATKLVALDTCELDRLRLELNREKSNLELEKADKKRVESECEKRICDLESKITKLRNKSRGANVYKFDHKKSLKICSNGCCRIMEYYENKKLLVTSCQLSNNESGIRKNFLDQDSVNTNFIPLHTNTIEDLAFHNRKELLLSVSSDKSAKITNSNNTPVSRIPSRVPLKSCCWDATNSNYFFLCEETGSVIKYDIRKVTEQLDIFKVKDDFSPVVSIQSIGRHPDGPFPTGGIIICKLNSCSVFVENLYTRGARLHSLNLDGPFVSMRYNNITEHLLVTARTTNIGNEQCARHSICTFFQKKISNRDTIQCNTLSSFLGAPVQSSRSCEINVAGDALVAAYQGSKKTIEIYSVKNGPKSNAAAIPVQSRIHDLCPIVINNVPNLCSLSDRTVNFFKINIS